MGRQAYKDLRDYGCEAPGELNLAQITATWNIESMGGMAALLTTAGEVARSSALASGQYRCPYGQRWQASADLKSGGCVAGEPTVVDRACGDVIIIR